MSRAEVAETERYLRKHSVNGLSDRKPRRFDIGDETLIVRVRESARAKTARIIVGPRRPLEVIVPRGISDTEVDDYLEEKRSWVARKVAKAREIAARPPQLGLDRVGAVWLEGREVPIKRQQARRATAGLRDGSLVVGGDDATAAGAVERWYRREARQRITEVAEREAGRLGLEFKSLGIRDQRTRWGSCSRKGNLSFSWRLLVAPREVLEYVVVHELCHVRVPTHAKPFWRLLETVRPGWQQQARWLREHGQELHDYQPARALELARSENESERRV
jgi:predicted metal-dependent hydrolase